MEQNPKETGQEEYPAEVQKDIWDETHKNRGLFPIGERGKESQKEVEDSERMNG